MPALLRAPGSLPVLLFILALLRTTRAQFDGQVVGKTGKSEKWKWGLISAGIIVFGGFVVAFVIRGFIMARRRKRQHLKELELQAAEAAGDLEKAAQLKEPMEQVAPRPLRQLSSEEEVEQARRVAAYRSRSGQAPERKLSKSMSSL